MGRGSSEREIGRLQGEHFTLGRLRIEPQERQIRVRFFQRIAGLADLDDERTVCAEIAGCGLQNAMDEIETIGAAGVGHNGFRLVLRREARHGVRCDVGRVGDDEIVFFRRDRFKQIGSDEPDAIAQPVIVDVAPGNFKRVG